VIHIVAPRDSTVQIAPGDAVQVQVEENRTTGYTWTTSMKSESRYESSPLAGSGGKTTFTIYPEGDASIVFTHVRRWDPHSKIGEFRVDVKVEQVQ
jgi:predicted secreted protein